MSSVDTSNSNNGDTSDGSTTTTSTTATTMPQILTRAALPGLIGDLDAGDVLECYAVTRMAPLRFAGRNHTLLVAKSAIALRYPAPLGSTKAPLELTLEYGPQRTGASLTHEAMPLLQLQDRFVTWENEGKVYYTTGFSTQDWTKANYMASLTGAVFELLLETSLDFSATHPRYQPVRVVSPDDLVRLKSSASHDFVYSVWEGLANAGVELQPILTPPTHVLRLHASSIQKVSGTDPEGRTVAHEAFEFYQNLYQCATAIETGNYQAWEPTAAPSTSPAPTLVPTTIMPTSAQTTTTVPTTTLDAADDTTTASPTVAPTKNNNNNNKKKNKKKNNNNNNGTISNNNSKNNNGDNNGDKQEDDENDNPRRLDGSDVKEDSSVPPFHKDTNSTDSYDDDALFSMVPSLAPSEASGDEAAKAKEAAQHAKEAAHEAKEAAHSPQDSIAADAAEAAANAAQAAAEATSIAATKAAMDAFRSGDGDLVTEVLRECFENPRYGIVNTLRTTTEQGDEIETNDTIVETYAYLYLDGSNYYRVNLTWPYMDIATMQRPLPQPPQSQDGGHVDFVDWMLALLVIVLLVVTVLALLQQVGYRIAFVNYQKWFFSPRHYQDAKSSANNSLHHVVKGEGFEHGFGEDVIPLSMGGRRGFAEPKVSSPGGDNTVSSLGLNDTENNINNSGDLGDLEMVSSPAEQALSSPATSGTISPSPKARSRSGSSIVVDLMDDENEEPAVMPRRFSRDPDLVDMPNLKSTSKVAVPVSRSSSTAYSDSSI